MQGVASPPHLGQMPVFSQCEHGFGIGGFSSFGRLFETGCLLSLGLCLDLYRFIVCL